MKRIHAEWAAAIKNSNQAFDMEGQDVLNMYRDWTEERGQLWAEIKRLGTENNHLIDKWQNDRQGLMQNLPGYEYKNRVDDVEWVKAKKIILQLQDDVRKLSRSLLSLENAIPTHGAIAEAELDAQLITYQAKIKEISELEADKAKLVEALEKIFGMLKQHPEAIRKADWKYEVYGIVTQALKEVLHD